MDQSKAVLVFISDGYFSSVNCVRELLRAIYNQVPIITLLETNMKHGGLSRADIKEALRGLPKLIEDSPLKSEIESPAWQGFELPSPAELFNLLLPSSRLSELKVANEPIEWTRISHYQVIHTPIFHNLL